MGRRVLALLAQLVQVLLPQGQGVHADNLGHMVQVGFVGDAVLGDPVAPHGRGDQDVGVHGPAPDPHIGAGVQTVELAELVEKDVVAVGGVSAGVLLDVDLPGHDGAILVDTGADLIVGGMAGPGAG